jgi:hypothetical protein
MGYFNYTPHGVPTKTMAMSSAIDIRLSEKELTMGITKLSGSRPLWKVNIETP